MAAPMSPYYYSKKFNIVTHMTPARQRLGKLGLKAGIAAEAEVNLLGNGTQTKAYQ
jgi:hypothetical protein